MEPHEIIDKNITEIKIHWEEIYWDFRKEKLDFSNLVIPASYNPNEYFGVIVAKGTTMEQVAQKGHRDFKYTDNLDTTVLINDRIPDEDYFVMFRRGLYADEDLLGISAKELREKQIKGITLLERLLLDRYADRHCTFPLDVIHKGCYGPKTLCFGSRDINGKVPIISWREPPEGYVPQRWYGYTVLDRTDYDKPSILLRGRIAHFL